MKTPIDSGSPIRLFDLLDRSNCTPAEAGESRFEFLNRVAGVYWDQTRGLIDLWYGRYPVEDRADLRGRLRSDDNNQHSAAAWELYLYEVFTQLGFKIEIHPSVQGKNTHPDFLISRGTEVFYVEVLTLLEPEANRQEERNVGLVYDAINRNVHHERFYLAVEEVQIGASLPRLKPLFTQLNRWLLSLNYGSLLPLLSQSNRLPTSSWSAGDWFFTFRALPVGQDRSKSRDDRIIGIEHARGRMVNDHEVIRERLRRKAQKYGKLVHPLIIALNYSRWTSGEDQLQKALFGYLDEGSDGMRTGMIPDIWPESLRGLWTSKRGPSTTNLSAVLCTENHSLARPTEVQLTMWVNPWSEHPLPITPPFRTVSVDGLTGMTSIREADITARALIGVESSWPLGNPFLE